MINGGFIFSVHFQADGSALWTSGTRGFFRWPIRRYGGGDWTLGPPELFGEGACGEFTISSDGRLAAILPTIGVSSRIVVRDLTAGGAVLRELEQNVVISPVFSPTGRWLATPSWHLPDLCIWDCSDFTIAHRFKPGTSKVCFSPDEQLLAVADGGRLEIDPSPQAFLERSEIFARLGDVQGALADLDRVLAASPGAPETLARRLAILRKEIGRRARHQESMGLARIDDARREWEELLSIDPEDAEACDRLAWLWILDTIAPGRNVSSGSVPEGAAAALSRVEKAHGAVPENLKYLRTLGILQYHTGRLEEARALLEKVWGSSKQYFTAAFYLAMIEARLGNPEKARRHFEEADAAGKKRLAESILTRDIYERIRPLAERTLRGDKAK